jgi:ribulose-phosphate 3-epimerase
MVLIAPSVLSANQMNIRECIRAIEEGGADLIHVDAIDGVFAPNIGFAPKFVDDLSRETRLEIDVHLMFYNPLRYTLAYAKAGARMISAHTEVLTDVLGRHFIAIAKEFGFKAGFALKPFTEPPPWLFDCLIDADYIVPMSVEPGFSGQKFIPQTFKNIQLFQEHRKKNRLNFKIEADGGVTQDNARMLVESGVDILVAGASVFNSDDIKGAISSLKRCAQI